MFAARKFETEEHPHWKLYPAYSSDGCYSACKCSERSANPTADKEALYAQILERMFNWLVRPGDRASDLQITVVDRGSQPILVDGRDISKADDGEEDEVIKEHGTGMHAESFSSTTFQVRVLWLEKGQTYPHLMEGFARTLTDAIWEKYSAEA